MTFQSSLYPDIMDRVTLQCVGEDSDIVLIRKKKKGNLVFYTNNEELKNILDELFEISEYIKEVAHMDHYVDLEPIISKIDQLKELFEKKEE